MRRMIVANALACLAGRSWKSSAAALAIVVGLGGGSAVAQQTFANISGAVTRTDGGPVQAITVEITHVPSGTRIVTAVGEGGRFNATGLRIGGPYTLRFSGEGLRDVVVERARLEPNEADPVNVTLVASDDGSEEDIVVIARRPAGTITDDDILVTPQIDRRLQDIVRLDSRAFVDRAQPEEDSGISILGFNTRFNNLVVDGLSQQDSFGQSFDGLPTRRAPVSLDAVESLAVQTAPFDVLNTNFQGGQINITTKSGGNEFHGSAFYQRTGGFLTGNRAGTNDAGLPVEFAPEQPENVWGAT
ncbi:MAG: TonB-dependent receptor, partial [Hyphomonadaceae bacterium]|nr:TonB-dependent receptor [Hyphomonadaceae bacterium]